MTAEMTPGQERPPRAQEMGMCEGFPLGWSRRLSVAIPLVVLFLTFCCWFGALLKSSFLADDFSFLVTYSNLSHFLTLKYDDGQITINVFWTIGWIAFGTGSAIPYLLLNSSVFALGLFLWLRAGSARLWDGIQGWWVASLSLAGATCMLMMLWSANSVHTMALLALGLALVIHERSLKSQRPNKLLLWSLLSALSFTLVVASDLLYVGILPLCVFCAAEQVSALRSLGSRRHFEPLAIWTVLLPLLYFLLIAYPERIAVGVYAGSSISYFAKDLSFYVAQMAPTGSIKAAYLLILLAAGIGSIWAVRYRRFFPIACCLSAALMAGIILSERQQLFTNYTFIPFLLILSACIAGWTTVFGQHDFTLVRRHSYVLMLAATLVLAVLFYSGGGIRQYFDATPYGTERGLVELRDSVASLSPGGEPICVVEKMASTDEYEFNMWIANGDAFLVQPVNASYAAIVGEPADCPAGTLTTIDVGVGRNGDFVVTGYEVDAT